MRLSHLAVLPLLAIPAAAYADTLQYNFTNKFANAPTHTFSFQLPSNPTPDQLMVNTAQGFLAVRSVAAVVDNMPGTYLIVFNLNNVSNTPIKGGDLILAGPFYNPAEPTLTYRNSVPLYSGDAFSPMFLTGTFTLDEFGAPFGGAQGLLTVTNLTTSVTPEPSSILLSLTGFLVSAGATLRRRLAPAR